MAARWLGCDALELAKQPTELIARCAAYARTEEQLDLALFNSLPQYSDGKLTYDDVIIHLLARIRANA